MSAAALYLGVDGGGTKTEFVCIDADGIVVARAVTGTTYHLQVGLNGAIAALEQGVAEICAQASIAPGGFAYAFFGLPAFDEDCVIDPQLVQACRRILGHDRFRCGNDMICGWAGSLACGDGINLVAGTGSIGYGERQGRSARAGGWGEVFGDEGSAYWIAIQGLAAFTKMSDGRLPKGPLHGHIVAALQLGADLDLCARVMGERGMSREEIAGLAPLVSDAATEGDAAADAILSAAAGELAGIARALRQALGYPPGEAAALSCSGGVAANAPLVRSRLERLLSQDGAFRLVAPSHAPGYGAALYAVHLHQQKPA